MTTEFKCDPHHAEACLQQTGSTVTERYNGVVRVVGQLARSVGASVRMDQPPLGEWQSLTPPPEK